MHASINHGQEGIDVVVGADACLILEAAEALTGGDADQGTLSGFVVNAYGITAGIVLIPGNTVAGILVIPDSHAAHPDIAVASGDCLAGDRRTLGVHYFNGVFRLACHGGGGLNAPQVGEVPHGAAGCPGEVHHVFTADGLDDAGRFIRARGPEQVFIELGGGRTGGHIQTVVFQSGRYGVNVAVVAGHRAVNALHILGDGGGAFRRSRSHGGAQKYVVQQASGNVRAVQRDRHAFRPLAELGERNGIAAGVGYLNAYAGIILERGGSAEVQYGPVAQQQGRIASESGGSSLHGGILRQGHLSRPNVVNSIVRPHYGAVNGLERTDFSGGGGNGAEGGMADDQVAFKLLVGSSERIGGSCAAVNESSRSGLRHDGLVSSQRSGVSRGSGGRGGDAVIDEGIGGGVRINVDLGVLASLHGTGNAVGSIAGKDCSGADVQGLPVRQVDGGFAVAGGGVIQDLGTVPDGNLATCGDHAVSGGIAGDDAVVADGDIVIRCQGGISLDGSIFTQRDAAFDGAQLFRTCDGIPAAAVIAVNGFVQVGGFCGNSSAIQDGIVSQGNIAALSFEGDGPGCGFSKNDAAGDAVIHRVDDGFAGLGVGGVKLFRSYGSDSRCGGHISVQRNLGCRIAYDLACRRYGILHRDVVAQDHGLFVGIIVSIVRRLGIGLAGRRRCRIYGLSCLAGDGNGFFHGNIVADAYLSVRGGDGGSHRLGIGSIIRTFDGNIPAINSCGI